MGSHIFVHRGTTKYISNSFASKLRLRRKDFREIARLPWAQTAFETHFDTVTIRWHFPQADWGVEKALIR